MLELSFWMIHMRQHILEKGSLAFPPYGILASSMEHEFIHMYQRDVQGKKVDTDKEKKEIQV